MKKYILPLLFSLISFAAFSQKGISYQAIILDPNPIEAPGLDIAGQPLVNGEVWMKFSIYNGSVLQFEEIHKTKTDAYGLVSLLIGSVSPATFNKVVWDANQKNMQVFASFNQGANYTKVSEQKLVYTPYALFSETAGKLGGTLAITGGGTGATSLADARVNLGVDKVDNTPDVEKPISTAVQAALDLKANSAEVSAALSAKADTGAIKTYVDNRLASGNFTSTQSSSATITDADASTKGKIQLAGDLGGTAAAPTVPGLALKANASDVATSLNLKANVTDVNNALALKAPIASPSFTGTVAAEAISTTSISASTFASTPRTLTYTGSAIDWNPAQGLNAAITLTQNSDLSFTTAPPIGSYGTVVLTQDATGNRTLSLPIIAGVTNKILGSTSTRTVALSTAANAKDILNFYFDGTNCYWNIGQGYGADASSGSTNLASGVTGTLSVANGGTGATNAADARTNLGLVIGTNVQAPLVAGTDYQAPITLTTTGSGAATLSGTTLNIPAVSSTVNSNTLSGTVAIANGGTGATSAIASYNALSPMTTTGDIVYRAANGNATRLGIGANATVLQVANGLPSWASISTGDLKFVYSNNNIGIGTGTTLNLATGSDNVAMGRNALGSYYTGGISGGMNIGIGTDAGDYNTTGSSNVYIGAQAGITNQTGNSNTFIGYNSATSVNRSIRNSISNSTAIGANAVVTTSNTIQLGDVNVTNVNTSGAITAPIYASTPQALTYASPISWNPANGLNASVTLTGNGTLSFSTAPTAGAYGTIVVTQDATGGRTLTLPSVTNKVLGSTTTTAIALSTAANAIDIVNFYFDGTNYFWNVGQGYGSAASITASNIAGGAAGSIPYQSAAGATSLLAKGTDGQILTLASGVPSWAAAPATGVTSVAMTTPTGLSVNGSPITSSGTLALSLTSGYAIPLTSSQTNWDAAYTNRITSASSPLSISSNALSLGTVPVSSGGTGATSASTALSNLGGAPIASPTFTGTPSAPTATAGTNTAQVATTAFVNSALSASGLPSQSGNNGKFLTTNGSTASWATPSIPLSTAMDGYLVTLSSEHNGYIFYTQSTGFPSFPNNLPNGFSCTIVNYSSFSYTSNTQTGMFRLNNSLSANSFTIPGGGTVIINVVDIPGQGLKYYVK